MADDEIYSTTIRTVLGSSRREHRWDLAHEMVVRTVLGRSFFDLRQVRPMGDEDCEISISCLLGTVELLVPVGTRVTLEGSTFLAGASSDVSGVGDVEPDPGGVDVSLDPLPRLDIAANAVLGRVRVRTPDRPRTARRPRFAGFRREKKPRFEPSAEPNLVDVFGALESTIGPPRSAATEPEDVVARPQATAESLPGEASGDTTQGSGVSSSVKPGPMPSWRRSSAKQVVPPALAGPEPFGGDVDTRTAGHVEPDPMARHPQGETVDADITRSEPVDGRVDVEIVRGRRSDDEPIESLDDFDSADFPDETMV